MRKRTRFSSSCRSLLLLVAAVGEHPDAASAVSPPFSVSPDVAIALGSHSRLVGPNDIVTAAAEGRVGPERLAIPPTAHVTGYSLLPNGDQLLCFDGTVELPGPLTVQPGDVVRHVRANSSYTIEMSAAENGVPPGADCDALTLDATGKLVLSFDVSVALPPGGFVADDEDLVRLTAPGTWDLDFDGSAAGVPAELDVDGAIQLPNGHLLLSFDGSGRIDGVDFDDEDVLEYDPAGPTWSLAFDGSAYDPDLAAADVEALPEPDFPFLLIGIPMLLALGRARVRAGVRTARENLSAS